MSTWSLHLVGHEAEEALQKLVTDFVGKLEAEGHVLERATLGTDAGSTELSVAVPADEPVLDTSREHVVTEDPANPVEKPSVVNLDTPPSL